jgi:hypothetical protein
MESNIMMNNMEEEPKRNPNSNPRRCLPQSPNSLILQPQDEHEEQKVKQHQILKHLTIKINSMRK